MGIIFAAKDHGARADEAANVVDVAVGVVAGDAPPQPEHIRHAQIDAQSSLDFLAAEARVADLRGLVEQALFRGYQGPSAVHVDAATFQHEALTFHRRAKQAAAKRAGGTLGDRIILLPVGVTRPAVEAEAHNRHFRLSGGTAGAVRNLRFEI